MVFLAFHLFKPETWLSGAADGVMGTILAAIRTLLFDITSIIFELMVNVYNLFDKLCKARILDNEVIETMSQRIGLVLGLVMFFYVVFSFIQMMVDPDKVGDKEKGAFQIAKKAVMVVIMLGVSAFFFEVTFGLQRTIIESEVIQKLLIPYNIQGLEAGKFGNLLSINLMNAFYEINSDIENGDVTISNTQGSNNYDDCKFYLDAFREQIYSNNKYDLGYICLNSSIDVTRTDENGNTLEDQAYVITFNSFIAPLVGGFTTYLLLMYCFKVGVRMIQLAFLEIISPMAIVSYLSPKKDNMFTKWWKIYFATYIDVFIRIAIINLVTFLICVVYSTDTAGGKFLFWETAEKASNGTERTFITVVIVLALLTFAKKAPDLLKELLPASASKLGFGVSTKDIVGLEKFGKWAPKAATGVLGGALGGAAIGLLGGGLGGFAGGLLKGGLGGLKGQGFFKSLTGASKSQAAANRKVREWRNAGGTNIFGRTWTTAQQALGSLTRADIQDAEIKEIENRIQEEKEHSAEERRTAKVYNAVRDAKKKIEDRAESKLLNGNFKHGDVRYAMQQNVLKAKGRIEELKQAGASAAEIAKATAVYNNVLDTCKKSYVTASYNHLFTDAAMESMQEDIRETISTNAQAFVGMNTTITDFATLDRFDGEVTNESNSINRRITASDARIQGFEDQILKTKTSDEYKRAHANKSYNGGK